MTANTIWAVLAVAACLLSASARPPGEGSNPGRKDLRLTLTPGSQTIYASWNVTLSNVTVTWKDQYDDGGQKFLGNASEALITGMRPATNVTVSVHAHSIENPPTAVESTRTLKQDVYLTLTATSESILAHWEDVFPRVIVTWADESGPKGNQTVDYLSEAKITNLMPCTFMTVSIRTENSDEPLFAFKKTRTSTKAPSKVSRLQSLSTTAQNVSLAWERPDTKCPIANYTITYSGLAKLGHRDKHSGIAIIDPEDATNYTVDGLHPDTNYSITVAARNEAGDGERVSIHVSTQEGVPSRPTELTSVSESSNSISLKWKEPEEHNGVVRNYSITWCVDGKEVNKTVVHYLTHTILGLSPCVAYTVRVAATTNAGEGAYQELNQTTAATLEKVHNAICTIAPDAQEVTIKWSKPESACPITGYELFWQNDAEQPFAYIDAFTAGPSLSYPAKMPSEKYSTVCVTAMLHEERGQRTCCWNNPLPKSTGGTSWLPILLPIAALVLVVGAAAVRKWREIIYPSQRQYQTVKELNW